MRSKWTTWASSSKPTTSTISLRASSSPPLCSHTSTCPSSPLVLQVYSLLVFLKRTASAAAVQFKYELFSYSTCTALYCSGQIKQPGESVRHDAAGHAVSVGLRRRRLPVHCVRRLPREHHSRHLHHHQQLHEFHLYAAYYSYAICTPIRTVQTLYITLLGYRNK